MLTTNYGTTSSKNRSTAMGVGGDLGNGDAEQDNETTSLLHDSNTTGSKNVTATSTTSISNGITFLTEEKAPLFSQLVFGWMAPMMRLGNSKGKLDPEDISLIPLPDDCRCENIGEAFNKTWRDELHRVVNSSRNKKKSSSSEPSLIRALFRAFGSDYVVGGFFLKLIHDAWYVHMNSWCSLITLCVILRQD